MTDLEEKNARQFYLEDARRIAHENVRASYAARKDAIEHLGVISDANASDPSISGNTLVNGQGKEEGAGFDVFAQTSTDHSGFNSDAEDDHLTFSEELSTEGHTLGTVVSDSCGL